MHPCQMDAQSIIKTVSELLGIHEKDTTKLLSEAFSQDDPFSYLSDLLGYSNVELIFEIFKNKPQFIEKDYKNKQGLFIEYIIPENEPVKRDNTLLKTSILKKHSKYFSYSSFNPVQSAVFNNVYHSDKNVLISAPTGAGKTDIALLAILRALKYENAQIIYIVPMKALASEIFSKYSSKFPNQVVEYTGDTEISSSVAANARIIVCTPEKFDSATRKLDCIFKSIRLVIIDEIHLLEDDRGPVLESIVARMANKAELTQSYIRIIGLSATLPNYNDVAGFIKASHIHFFDKTYRPVPLKMTITGFIQSSRLRDEQNYIVEKIQEFLRKKKQVMVFVHSRAKTHNTANFLIKNLSKCHLNTETLDTKIKFDADLHHMVSNGIGVHHAGLSKNDRHLIEKLFSEGQINVLVCTSTLAWGVNLPAYAVIIHGSSFYNPDLGRLTDISILDVLQIFGRAGRPQFDVKGEAILITKANKIDKYVALLKRSDEIESKMLFSVPECLNSEIYLKNVVTMSTALSWIKNTFLYIRMMKNPAKYGILSEELGKEEQALSEYIYLTLRRLEDCRLIKIHKKDSNYNTWSFESTLYGQITSLYYLNHLTMYSWLSELDSIKSEMSLILLLIRSEEFKQIAVRKEEIEYLANIHQELLLESLTRVDFDETVESKLLILFISFIHYKKMPIFTLECDTNFLIENMKRLIAAMKEILLYMEKYSLYHIAFILEKKINRLKSKKIRGLTIKGTRINDMFVDISVSNITEASTAFVYHDQELMNVLRFNNHIIKCIYNNLKVVIHTNENWDVFEENIELRSDYSSYALYKYGIHCCDTVFTISGSRTDCVHFHEKRLEDRLKDLLIVSETDSSKSIRDLSEFIDTEETYNNEIEFNFKLDMSFNVVETRFIGERLKLVTQLISEMSFENVLIICPSSFDVKETVIELNTLMALKKRKMTIEYSSGANLTNSSKFWICTFEESMKIYKKFTTVIFKSLGPISMMFPVYEIFKISDRRKSVIFETQDRIDFIKTLIR